MERTSDNALGERSLGLDEGASRAILARRIFVWLSVAAYASFFSVVTVLRHESFNSGTFDLAFMDQALWNTLRGNVLGLSIEPHIGTSELAYHFEPIFFPIAALYALWPSPNLLLILQSVALGLGALPASWLAYDRLRSNLAAAVFALAYLLFPGLQAANMFDFHPFALSAPALLFAFYYMQRRDYLRFAVFAALAMATKENVPLTIAMFGLYQMFMLRQWRLGTVTIAGAAVWFLVASYLIIPAYNQEGQGWLWNRYGGMGGSPFEILGFLLIHPERLIEPAPGLSNLFYMQQLLFPLAFLSLLHPPSLLLAAPGLATNLLTTYEAMHLIETYHYTSSLAPIVVISAILGTGVLTGLAGRVSPAKRRPVLWVVAAAVLATSLAYHYYRGYTPLSPSFSLSLPDAHDAIGHRLVASIPAEASVSAQYNLGPHVSQRTQFTLFPDVRDADFIFVDVASQPNMGGVWDGFHDTLRAAVDRPDYGIVAAEDGYLLLQRGAPKVAIPEAFYSFAVAPQATPSHEVQLRFGDDLELMGFDLQHGREAMIDATLYWRARRPLSEDYLLALFVTDGQGNEMGATKDAQPANYWYPTSRWRPGEIVKVQTLLLPWAPKESDFGLGVSVVKGKDPWDVAARLPVSVEEADWNVQAAGGGTVAEFVTFKNDRGLASPNWRPRPRQEVPNTVPLGSVGGAQLVDAEIQPTTARPGETVRVRLVWHVMDRFAVAHTTFVHVLAPGPRLVAQKDAPPVAGRLPTSFWQPGDALADEYLVDLPADLAPGEYEIAVGLYDPLTGKRQATVDATGNRGDFLLLPEPLVVRR